MESIKLRQHVDQDGFLRIKVPDELADREIEVMIIYQPVQISPDIVPLDQLYGICADDPIVLEEDNSLSGSLDDDLAGAFD